MYDLARSCQEFPEKCQYFSTELGEKKSIRKNREVARIMSTNPGKPRTKREKARVLGKLMDDL